MGSNFSCPHTYALIGDKCYANCSLNYSPAADDYSLCVANNVCPATYTVQNSTITAFCNKVSQGNTNPFPANTAYPKFVQYPIDGNYYVTCPDNFTDNDLTCEKNTAERVREIPTCTSVFYEPSAGKCVLRGWVYISIFAGGIILLVMMIWFKMKMTPSFFLHQDASGQNVLVDKNSLLSCKYM